MSRLEALPDEGPGAAGAAPGDEPVVQVRRTQRRPRANQAFDAGIIGKTVESLMSKLKPEAAYFGPSEGKRSGMIFFDLAEPSQIVEVVEPLFSDLHAAVEIVPVMSADDLRKGIAKVKGH
jgi:hypothetical protein